MSAPGPRRRRDEAVRVAVVGVGSMGANHARIYSGLKGVDLVAVVDPDPDRARHVAELYGGTPMTSCAGLEGQVDAATVAVPSADHAAVGLDLLARGIDCLIEKPLATNPGEGQALVEAAAAHDRMLLVGHIERFNPAVDQLAQILRDGPPVLAVEARRMSAVSARVTDVDVIADLMIHDLDIVLGLLGTEVVDVAARGAMVEGGRADDYVTALLTFATGSLASLTASRVTQNQIRALNVTTAERFYTVDYSAQELCIYRQGRIGSVDDEDPGGDGQYILDVGTERVFVRRTEPLAAELSHFIDVVHRRCPPKVDGATSLRAVELVDQIRVRVEEPARV